MAGLVKTFQKIKGKFKNEKSKEESKPRLGAPTPPNSLTTTTALTQSSEPSGTTTAARGGKRIPASPHVTSPHTSPHVASPATSAERMDDSRGERDQSDSGATAKSIKEKGMTEHYGQFLDHMAGKGWQKVADEFKTGYRTNAEVNRTTRYVISFNVPPDGDFYDANRVEFPGIDQKIILAAVPDTTITSKETFWRMVYDASPSIVMFVENYEAETKDTREKPFIPWGKGDTKDYGKMQVLNKKTTNAGAMDAMVEILPEGCSNSLVTRFVQVLKWPETVLGDPDGSSRNMALHAVRMIKEEKGPILVVCNNGCGRSAMFVMLHAILTRLNSRLKVSSKFPRLKDQTSAMKKSLNAYVEKTYTKKK